MSTTSSNINDSFFAGSYKHAWKGLIPPGLTEAEVDFIQEIGGLDNNSGVLDLMCGYGRHSLELARRGVNITSIDNLEDYIQEIRATASAEALPIKAVAQDILSAEIQGSFDAAICMGNSFAFFGKDEAVVLLKKISQHLKPGGVFIINSWMIAEIAIRHFKAKDWHYAGDYKCLLEYEYCFNPARIESEQTIISKEGTVETVQGVDYIFTLDELEQMFQEAGLQTKSFYSTPRKRRFALGDTQIYIVAEKFK